MVKYNRETLDKIGELYDGLAGDPDYFLKRKKCLRNGRRTKEFITSFLLEHPNYSEEDSLDRAQTKNFREGINALEAGWKYLKREVPSVEEDLDESKLLTLGRTIHPSTEGYRTTRASMGLPNYIPPNPAKVPEMVQELLLDIKDEDLHPIERAFLLHLGIAAIQPRTDGNKRTARLLQDKALDELWLPPATVPLSKRRGYINVLESGMAAFREKDIDGQRPFFDYMEARLLSSLKDLDFCIGRK